jgi:glycosyltransferase involved in cell wall biosynthesis
MANIPILIVGDAVSSQTGLGRIAREIAVRMDANLKDVCRVATLGCGGPGSRKFNFPQYSIEGMGGDFMIPNLPEVWEDWAGREEGVMWCIWDASRLGWFSRSSNPEFSPNPHLKQFFQRAKFKRWIYAPVDGDGPFNRLSYALVQCLLGFDRVLAYGRWGEDVIRKSLGDEPALARDLSFVPHGLDSSIFHPYDQTNSRLNFFSLTGGASLRGIQTAVLKDDLLIGTVATNQNRKDWGLWAESCSLFLGRHSRARFWIHIDEMERYWSIPQLLIDHGLMDRTIISLGYLEDAKMAQAYSACDLTLGIGPEGFGYPIFESIFCGTPCVTGNYAGAPEHLSDDFLVDTIAAYRLDGLYSVRRPVYKAQDWADKMEAALGKNVEKPEHLDWDQVWPRFDKWLRKGLAMSGAGQSLSHRR